MTALLQSPGLVGPITFWQVNQLPGVSAVLTETSNPGQRLIICWMTLVSNVNASAGDSARITLNGVIVHSGFTGAGTFDRFPLDCLIAMERFDIMALTTFGTGTWSTVGVGYYAPAFNIG